MSKALAYEISKQIPLETFEQLRSDETPNDLLDVCGTLISTHLPGWLYYAINKSDHTVRGLDTKVPRYIDAETIEDVATDYSEAEHLIINLNTHGGRDWMQDDPMKPHREQFEQTYADAVAGVSSALYDVLAETESMNANTELCDEFATYIIDRTDLFSWVLTEKEMGGDPTVREISEVYVRTLGSWDIGRAYFDWHGDDRDRGDYLRASREIGKEFSQSVESLSFHTTEGYTPTALDILPRNDERLNEVEEAMRGLQDRVGF